MTDGLYPIAQSVTGLWFVRRAKCPSTMLNVTLPDCFYASVIHKDLKVPKSLPLAVQQKQIIVTCNYEARRRGLYKLQLVQEAKKTCPDMILILGEDLTRFRNASKENYKFLRGYSWSNKVERLGFDEVSLSVPDLSPDRNRRRLH